jgi:hypothetical protein
MTAAAWTTMPAGTVRRGDVVKLGSGTELAVTRVEAPFLGRDDLVCLIEDSGPAGSPPPWPRRPR